MRTLLVPAIILAFGASSLAQNANQPGYTQPGRPGQPGKQQPQQPKNDKPKRDGLKKPEEKEDKPDASEPPVPVTLKVGSPAPKLSVDAWVKAGGGVKGEITELPKGQVAVIQFFSSWARASVKNSQDLSKLWKDNAKDLTVLAVAASEKKPQGAKPNDPDRRLDTLRQFVNQQGRAMEFAVAFDADRSMSRDWMQAAGQTSIPTAFVISHDGKIVWIGSPLSQDKEMAEAVAAALKAQSMAGPATKPEDMPKKR